MGKGDKKTKRGKIIIGSYGVRRPKKKKAAFQPADGKKEAKPKKAAPKEEKTTTAKKTTEKKPAPKKPAAKKTTTKKAEPAKEEVKAPDIVKESKDESTPAEKKDSTTEKKDSK